MIHSYKGHAFDALSFEFAGYTEDELNKIIKDNYKSTGKQLRDLFFGKGADISKHRDDSYMVYLPIIESSTEHISEIGGIYVNLSRLNLRLYLAYDGTDAKNVVVDTHISSLEDGMKKAIEYAKTNGLNIVRAM